MDLNNSFYTLMRLKFSNEKSTISSTKYTLNKLKQ